MLSWALLRWQERTEERTARWRGSGSVQAAHPLGDTRWTICARGDALLVGPGEGVAGVGSQRRGGGRPGGQGADGEHAFPLPGWSTVSTMSLLLTSPTCMSSINTANFIRMLRIGTEGLIIPAGSTTGAGAGRPLNPPIPLPPLPPPPLPPPPPAAAGPDGDELHGLRLESRPGPGFSLAICPS